MAAQGHKCCDEAKRRIMLCTIFTLRPDGASWQHRGEIEAPNQGVAKHLAHKMFTAIDGVKRELCACAPGDPFPTGAPNTKYEPVKIVAPAPKPVKVAAPEPITRGRRQSQPVGDFSKPKRRPLGRFRPEDAERALAQDDRTRQILAELFDSI